jgi:ABC-type dipeptide/oligopeptide/nickel transport system permease subunit
VSAVTSDALIFEHDTLAQATGGRWEGLFGRIVVVVSALVLGVIVICAIFAPWLAPNNPNTIHLLNPYANPSHAYLFGQDSSGRDIFSRLIYGARLSLLGPLIVVAIAFAGGVPLGFLAAYRGGFVDGLISRVFDVVFAFPALLLAIVIVATFGASFQTAVFAVAITYVPLMGRVVRSAALVERSKPYVEECRLQGYGAFRILLVHVMPNIGRILVSQTTLYFAYGLLDLSALSFLGLGAQSPQIDWGGMLQDANQGVFQSPYGVIFPALAIVFLVVSLNFIADWALDYRRRKEDRG